MSVTVKHVCHAMETIAPSYMAEHWDNVGLLLGKTERSVKKILVALDVTPAVIEEAIEKGADMLITHHPVPFKAIKKVTDASLTGRLLLELAENKISLFSAHTNLDNTKGGTADYMAEVLGVKNAKALVPVGSSPLFKLVVFVPNTHAEQVRNALGDAGAGHIGDYSHCSFETKGTGHFKPLPGTTPFIGEENEVAEVDEVRLETVVSKSNKAKILEAMCEAHPYEEVAYDLYPLDLSTDHYGSGKLGNLEQPMRLKELAELVKERLNLPHIQFAGDANTVVEKVAFCTGSAMDFLPEALASGAQAFITGDMRYHDVLDGLHQGLTFVNASHFGTEFPICNRLKEYLSKELDDVAIEVTEVQQEPFNTL